MKNDETVADTSTDNTDTHHCVKPIQATSIRSAPTSLSHWECDIDIDETLFSKSSPTK